MSDTKPVTVSVFGCLPFLLGCLLLGGLGVCGTTCKTEILGGIHDLRQAVSGAPVDAGKP